MVFNRMSSIHLCVLLLMFFSHLPANDAFDGRTKGGKRWGVILAGARTYVNYFSQANACHAYHVLRNGGIPADNIIHLNYDDVANNKENPVKNNLINTLNGTNFYDGCVIDYRGEDVTPDVFVNVLTGNKTGVEILTGKKGKVLESGPDDEVFLFMSDHGGVGVFFFPNTHITVTEFSKALKTMYQNKMYSQMVVFMDSCNSGSMFSGHLPDNINIYAIANANPKEEGYLSCWDDDRMVFLSSMFGYTWMYNIDQLDRNKESLHQLFETVKLACSNYSVGVSHPQQYGNISLNKNLIDRFMGDHAGTGQHHVCKTVNFVDKKTLTMLANEFIFPFEEDVLSPQFLQRPPIDMGGVATLIRRLMSKRLTHDDRESLKAELNYSLKVNVMAQEIIKSVEDYVTKSVENSESSSKDFDKIITYDCYNQAMAGIQSQCPVLEPQRFPFVNRNFKSLLNLCKVAGYEVVMNAVVTSTTKLCRVL